jgi:hypothetical protein
MPAHFAGEIRGAKEAIKSLRQIDPELRKQFTKDAKLVAAPIITDAKNSYSETLLSGMARTWSQNGTPKFPYSSTAARRGLRFKVDTTRKAGSAVKIQQKDPAAAIIEVAGKKRPNRLGTALNRFGQPSRFLWPAAERNQDRVQREMEALIRDVMDRVERDVK